MSRCKVEEYSKFLLFIPDSHINKYCYYEIDSKLVVCEKPEAFNTEEFPGRMEFLNLGPYNPSIVDPLDHKMIAILETSINNIIRDFGDRFLQYFKL